MGPNQQPKAQASQSTEVDKHRFVKIDFKSEPNFEKNTRDHPLRTSGAINPDGVIDLNKVSLDDLKKMLSNTDGYTSNTFLTTQVSIAKLEQQAQNSGDKFLSAGLDVKIDGVLALKENGKFLNPRNVRNNHCEGSFEGIASGGVSKDCLDKLSSFAIAVADIQENRFGGAGKQVDGVPGPNFLKKLSAYVDKEIQIAETKIEVAAPEVVASALTSEETPIKEVVLATAPKTEVVKAQEEVKTEKQVSSKLPQYPDVSKLAIGKVTPEVSIDLSTLPKPAEEVRQQEAQIKKSGMIKVSTTLPKAVETAIEPVKIAKVVADKPVAVVEALKPKEKATTNLNETQKRNILDPERLEELARTGDLDAVADFIKELADAPNKLRHHGNTIAKIVHSLTVEERLEFDSKFDNGLFGKGIATYARRHKASRESRKFLKLIIKNSKETLKQEESLQKTKVKDEPKNVPQEYLTAGVSPIALVGKVDKIQNIFRTQKPEAPEELKAEVQTKSISLPSSDLPVAQLTKELKAAFSKPFDGAKDGQAVLDLVAKISERQGALSLINANYNKRVGRTPVNRNKDLINVLKKNQVSSEVLERISTFIKEDKAEITKYQKSSRPVNARTRRTS